MSIVLVLLAATSPLGLQLSVLFGIGTFLDTFHLLQSEELFSINLIELRVDVRYGVLRPWNYDMLATFDCQRLMKLPAFASTYIALTLLFTVLMTSSNITKAVCQTISVPPPEQARDPHLHASYLQTCQLHQSLHCPCERLPTPLHLLAPFSQPRQLKVATSLLSEALKRRQENARDVLLPRPDPELG